MRPARKHKIVQQGDPTSFAIEPHGRCFIREGRKHRRAMRQSAQERIVQSPADALTSRCGDHGQLRKRKAIVQPRFGLVIGQAICDPVPPAIARLARKAIGKADDALVLLRHAAAKAGSLRVIGETRGKVLHVCFIFGIGRLGKHSAVDRD